MRETFTRLDIAEYLDSEEIIAEYLKVELESEEPGAFLAALGYVARARSMSRISEVTGLGRESLYKALQPGSKVRFETVQKVLGALGLKLAIETAEQDRSAVK